jgi:hypothetical protein
MKKVITALFGVVVASAVPAAAQAPVEMIVYDQCYADAINWEYVCGVYMSDPDGLNTTRLTSSGTQPVWSPDGTRIAFVDGSPSDIVLLNLSDENLSNLTNHPAQHRVAGLVAGRRANRICERPRRTARALSDERRWIRRQAPSLSMKGSSGCLPGFAMAPASRSTAKWRAATQTSAQSRPTGQDLVRLTSDPRTDSGAAGLAG